MAEQKNTGGPGLVAVRLRGGGGGQLFCAPSGTPAPSELPVEPWRVLGQVAAWEID